MHGVSARLSAALLGGILSMVAEATPLEALSLSKLEQRLEEMEAQLAQLANYSLGGGIGAIGYRSQAHNTEDHPEWFEIELGETAVLDEVVLVPAIRRDTASGFQADGFPKAFRLVVGTSEDREGRVVAEYSRDHGVLPRIAPLVIPCRGMPASWIRIEALILSLRAFDQRYVFQLSEVLAFSGQDNVALHKPVKSAASSNPVLARGWADRYVVDGFVPYLMNAAHGEQSVAYVAPTEIVDDPLLTIELGTSYPLSRIHLHAVDQSDTLPQAFAGDFGIPKVLRIEGANQPDFSDAKVMIDMHHDTIYEVGQIMMRRFPETNARYVRLKVLEPYATSFYGQIRHVLGFAEIGLFSGSRNVALHKTVTANFKSDNPIRRLSSLTDGLNMYGSILPIRDWMNQLALRHELERERPLVVAALNQRYARQKTNLNRMIWLTLLLALGAVTIVLVDRSMRQRAIDRTRKRIAADLHDELGADLHAIGLLSDLAQAARAAPEKLGGLLQRLRVLSERTVKAARYWTNLLEARGLYGDLVNDMRRASARIMADLEHEIEFAGEESLRKLKPEKRIDLFLFYQECLINIIRHSGATRAHTRLSATDGEICLTVTDNGQRLNGEIPASLKRRARLLGAQVATDRSGPDATCIRLRLKTGRFGFLK